jgi:hypothetical protein
MLHAGLDLSRKRLDVCLLSEHGELVEEFAAPPDADGLRGLVRHVGHHGAPVRAVIESMTGARFVHDTLETIFDRRGRKSRHDCFPRGERSSLASAGRDARGSSAASVSRTNSDARLAARAGSARAVSVRRPGRGCGYGPVSAGRWALTPRAMRNSAATSRVAASAPSGNT